MDGFDDNFKNTISLDLYKSPLKKRIQYDIFDLLNIRLYPSQLKSYRKQLVVEELITEYNPDEEDSFIEITPEGYKAIQVYGDYMNYIKAKQREVSLSITNQEMQQKYLKLKIISTATTIILVLFHS